MVRRVLRQSALVTLLLDQIPTGSVWSKFLHELSLLEDRT